MNEQKFELQKRIYSYALKIVRFVKSLPKNYEHQILGNQLLRSGTSVAANVIEAYAASSKKDFINFYHHALKSTNESKLWLALIRDTNDQGKDQIKGLFEETIEIGKILAASLLTMKNKRRF
ncbi:MAG: hypothetical protein A2729_00185 [Candidatus Buchananbacteria bacterium RIFCSPHIGHO2_01_FULL_39_14]|uniref:Four helix bundle protein n=2 Tax=Candidatus Buchananiibacteriota TaxID=1817903 RepID=A0A1G1YN16_9BACT|nr:MAG: hypothetical protein A2729_00185 [Candidatus Buchananbacteria bacterium RIFCSPHIGHO2_01_FULL_39_14]OGY48571.1 MAG: hypothetical protein A3D39_05540 [Candidatus Buchananbacteria bacterium RIFCSPHIGHO2_02_FULL_39_17]OGY53689.1 MAG: hypothetical protein A2912_05085 [Candidatus Buchananbacteria bacterium RIFCSPLOWO2_01_FULL_40_23b]